MNCTAEQGGVQKKTIDCDICLRKNSANHVICFICTEKVIKLHHLRIHSPSSRAINTWIIYSDFWHVRICGVVSFDQRIVSFDQHSFTPSSDRSDDSLGFTCLFARGSRLYHNVTCEFLVNFLAYRLSVAASLTSDTVLSFTFRVLICI